MQASKILLSEEELKLAENSDWILTKNQIIKKIISLFAQLADSYREATNASKEFLPEEVLGTSPKISRGEQYQGLPYVMLDYPRVFSKEDVFAIRTFFWWGNFFSLTLHLKGKYKQEFGNNLKTNISLLSQHNFFIAESKDEWRQDFEADNYTPVIKTDPDSLIQKVDGKDFLKLAVKWPLKSSNEIATVLENHHALLMRVIVG